ncbi:MAG: hypothetical protein IKU37_01455 [Candidatus Gastranaerophilales bacterium]|nr:hypothetical protein [Candidatus Gastranaerophilales bacterium]
MNRNEFVIVACGILILLLITVLYNVGIIAIDQAEVIRGYETECNN